MDEAQCQRLVTQTVDTYGRIDTLLYNAGKGYPARFDSLKDVTTIRNEITLNYLGLVYCAFYALPHLKQSKGRLVGVSSFGSWVGLPGTAGYNASKHAMRGFLNSLRVELRGTGVTITMVFPGAVRTERLQQTMGKNVDRVPTMSPERCAELTIQAAAARRRQMIMTAEGKLLVWLYQFVPELLESQLARLASLYDEA
jgi:short-subunit dehydrogenase